MRRQLAGDPISEPGIRIPANRPGAGPERPQYYAAYAILTCGFPMTKDVAQKVGEADPPGLEAMMQRVRVIPSHTQALFSPRVMIITRDGVAHTHEATGREFFMTFDELAQRLAPIGAVARIGETQYAQLVAACRQIDRAQDIAGLIALTCPPAGGRGVELPGG